MPGWNLREGRVRQDALDGRGAQAAVSEQRPPPRRGIDPGKAAQRSGDCRTSPGKALRLSLTGGQVEAEFAILLSGRCFEELRGEKKSEETNDLLRHGKLLNKIAGIGLVKRGRAPIVAAPKSRLGSVFPCEKRRKTAIYQLIGCSSG